MTGSDVAAPPPGRTPSARVPFKTIFHKTAVVIGNLTVAVLLIKEAGGFLHEATRLGLGEAVASFAVGFTIEVMIVVLVNCLVVALPIAGLIYYARYLVEER